MIVINNNKKRLTFYWPEELSSIYINMDKIVLNNDKSLFAISKYVDKLTLVEKFWNVSEASFS